VNSEHAIEFVKGLALLLGKHMANTVMGSVLIIEHTDMFSLRHLLLKREESLVFMMIVVVGMGQKVRIIEEK
jgi:hypothetical protein